MNPDYLKLVVGNILHRRLRSWLTVIGIVIGVASIVGLVLVSQGLENAIREQFEAFGTDKIYVLPPNFQGGALEDALSTTDVAALESIPEVDYAVPLLAARLKLEFKNDVVLGAVNGLPSDRTDKLLSDFNLAPAEGRWFSSDSDQVVIGYNVVDDMFNEPLRINSRLLIDGRKFTVVGILEEIGNPEDDSQLYIPLGVMRDLTGNKNGVSFIQVKAKPGTNVNAVAQKMQTRLEKTRSKESFDISTAEDFLNQLGDILGIVQGILVSIAAIALIVGAVGIATSMYTAVAERTAEIGVMKAIGAGNNTILMLFLMEAAIIGLVGGLIGIALGIAIAYGVAAAASSQGFSLFKIVVDPLILLFGLAFAMGVGMLSGAFPARQAARLRPVEAIRKR